MEVNLWGPIKPEECKYTATPIKIEIHMPKERAGKWGGLRRNADESVFQGESLDKTRHLETQDGLKKEYACLCSFPLLLQLMMHYRYAELEKDLLATPAKTAAAAPSTPSTLSDGTSWVNTPPMPIIEKPTVEKSIIKQSEDTATEAKPAGPPAYPTSSKKGPQNWDKIDEEEDDEKDKDANDFFKTLYAGATPEQQRAMMKSFVESNGTALSTDWDDVKNRKVETVPPTGSEVKNWEK
jgi:hypothetical protein